MSDYDFYIVPTPIGNLSDISNRAIEVLKMVDYIACEDSRVTQKLLNHYNISTKCISYHKYNENERIEKIVELLENGNKFALVSDAGTPLICDPGSVIVKELRKRGFKITALPGANAVVTFLSQISRADEQFTFIGFLPKSESKIEEIITQHKYQDTVFYDSPNRIIQTLKIIQKIRPTAKIAIARELTKIFEEVLVDSVDNIINHYENNISKGEFVAMVFRENEDKKESNFDEQITKLLNKGYSAKDVSVIISELYKTNKNSIYKSCIEKLNKQ